MQVIYAIIFGLVQGLTEFLPISSSGHLLIFHQLFKLDFLDSLSFDAFLHLGTLAALLIYFWRDIWRLINAWLNSLKHWNLATDFNQRLAWLILLAAIPAGVFGLLFEKIIEEGLRNLWVVVAAFMFIGIVLVTIEKKVLANRTLEALTWRNSLTIGAAQILSLIPGVSRSGITLIAGLIEGISREEAARFSFLVSLPLVAGAGLKKAWDLYQLGLFNLNWPILFIGFLAAAISGILVIKFFLDYLRNHSLAIFGWYRIIIAAILILFLLIK